MKKTNPELDAIAKRVISKAKRAGANQASASVSRVRAFRVGTRNGEIETLEESTDRGLYFRVFVDDRYSTASTSDLRPEAIDSFVEECVEAARLLHPDPDRSLPEGELMTDPPVVDLDNFDPYINELPKENKLKLALDIDKAARGVDSSIFSAQGSYSESQRESVLITSEGFEGSTDSSSFGISGSATVQDSEHRRQSQWSWKHGVKFKALEGHTDVGVDAAQQAMRMLGAQPIDSGIYDLVIENRRAGWFIRQIMGALSGRALYQDQSFLKDKLNKEVAASLLTITDNPLLPREPGSRLFDGESLPSRIRPIIQSGVLKNYYLDTYYARKLGMKPTSSSSTNIVFTLGDKSADQIIKAVDKGLMVNQFLGGNTNSLTGDFSVGIGGFLIENGHIMQPVAEMNIAGRVQDLFMSVSEIGNDPFEYSSWKTPTLRLPRISVAGK